MKLIIQVPCLNEEETLPIVLNELPREVPGFDTVEWLIVDDGSTDKTVDVARENGVDHIISFHQNRGLAQAFIAGLEASMRLGADVIVNTDADNQYDASCIPDLVRPIVERRALIVVGARPIGDIPHFSPIKKVLQRLGSWAVRVASGSVVEDAPSGFRAIHKDAAKRLNVFNSYTYTLETIIQAGRRNIPIVSVPIRINEDLRPSRLVKSISSYIQRSLITVLRIFIVYAPMRFFSAAAALTAAPGMVMIMRFLFEYTHGRGEGNVQSLVLSAALLAISAIIFMSGIVAELVAVNRQLLEDIRVRQLDLELHSLEGATKSAARQNILANTMTGADHD